MVRVWEPRRQWLSGKVENRRSSGRMRSGLRKATRELQANEVQNTVQWDDCHNRNNWKIACMYGGMAQGNELGPWEKMAERART